MPEGQGEKEKRHETAEEMKLSREKKECMSKNFLPGEKSAVRLGKVFKGSIGN